MFLFLAILTMLVISAQRRVRPDSSKSSSCESLVDKYSALIGKNDLSQTEALALEKATFLLKHPYEALPALISDCENSFKSLSRFANKQSIYHDLVIKQTYLADILPLGTPEAILHVLLDRKVSKKQTAKIVDIGANVGQFALPLAEKGHMLYSFEPVDSTCQKLKDQVAYEKLEKNFHITCAGIDTKRATQSFGFVGDRDPGSASYSLIDPKDPNAHVMSTVRTGPIHDFLKREALTDVLVFKTDTQGNEEAVLRGARELLHASDHPRFLLIEYSKGLLASVGTKPETILEIVYDAGYLCTHLQYHHLIERTGGNLVYKTLDTPASMTKGSIGASFEMMAKSIDVHDEWRLDGSPLSKDVAMGTGWSDLLCFG